MGEAVEDREDVIKFLAANGVDDRASDALLGCDHSVQDAVMARGDLTDARNPSSAILGRIRDACRSFGNVDNSQGQSLDNVEAEMQHFIGQFNLDDRAVEALRSAAPQVQKAVLARGSLCDARNPSSAVLGRIRDAQNDWAKAAGKGQQGLPRSAPDEVEAFIAESGVDERASEALLKASPEVQHAVVTRGSLRDARNPSSAMLGRLRDAEKQEAAAFFPVQGPPSHIATMRGGMPLSSSMMQRQFAGLGGQDLAAAVEEFIRVSGLDERAVEALRTSPPWAQQLVLERDVGGARNPSSMVLGRLRDAKSGGKGGDFSGNGGGGCGWGGSLGCGSWGGGGEWAGSGMGALGGMGGFGTGGKAGSSHGGGRASPTAAPEEVQQFIINNALDERAADAFQACAPEIQRIVIDRGGLQDARNPSSAILGRIRDAQSGKGGSKGGDNNWISSMGAGGMGRSGMGGMPNMMGMASGCSWGGGIQTGDILDFITENTLDDRAAEELMNSDPAVQQSVISRGALSNARNPSSAVLGRIRDAKQQLGVGARGVGIGKGRYTPY